MSDVSGLLVRLNARLQLLEDEREIRELLAVYGYYADTMRDEDYLGLWTDDGTMDLVGSMYTAQDANAVERIWSGKDRVREFISDPTAHHRPDFYGKSMHVQGNNLVIKLDGDEATATSYSIVLQQIAGKATVVSAGANKWLLRRESGGWRIAERTRREIAEPDIVELLRATA